MLEESQANRILSGDKVEAEVRSMYFADLASKYTQRQQGILGASMCLSLGASITITAHLPSWRIPAIMTLIAALLAAYSIAVDLTHMIITTTRLHDIWTQLAFSYEALWRHQHDESAEERYRYLQARASYASQLGAEIPYKKDLMEKWRAWVAGQQT